MEDYSILTFDKLIEKLTSLRDYYKAGNAKCVFLDKNGLPQNFTSDNFWLTRENDKFVIDTSIGQ